MGLSMIGDLAMLFEPGCPLVLFDELLIPS